MQGFQKCYCSLKPRANTPLLLGIFACAWPFILFESPLARMCKIPDPMHFFVTYYGTTLYCYDSLDQTAKNSNVSGASHFFPYLDSQAPTAVVIGRTIRTAGQMSVSWKEFGAVHK